MPTLIEFTKPLASLSLQDRHLVGGKGASLGKLVKEGFNVPKGFVVLSNAFEFFLEQTGIGSLLRMEMNSLNSSSSDFQVQAIAQRLRLLICHSEIPLEIGKDILASYQMLESKLVAVRSSAAQEDGKSASWAGQFESFLNTDRDKLFENVRLCWASLFTERAIRYRLAMNEQDQSLSMAVVVQQMIESETSGVAFSANPVSNDLSEIVIEAIFGLGELLVSGRLTPDCYRVNKNTFELINLRVEQQKQVMRLDSESSSSVVELEEHLGKKQKLCVTDIIKLARIIDEIESFCGFPVDVEWAMQGGQLFILQCRPITCLGLSV